MTGLNLLAPQNLWLLLLLPLLCSFAFLAYALRTPAPLMWRHTPLALLLVTLLFAIAAATRPAMTSIERPSHVILALDVSGGMRADDVPPSRLVAAQSAAKGVIAELPAETLISIVAFGAEAELVQGPTTNRDDLISTVDRLSLRRGTSLAAAILRSLDAAPEGASSAVILISDGVVTTGQSPDHAAEAAAKRGIRVFTAGVGTPAGRVNNIFGQELNVLFDPEALRAVAKVTGGEYFSVASQAQGIDLGPRLAPLLSGERNRELWILLAALAAVFLAAAGEVYRRLHIPDRMGRPEPVTSAPQ